MTKNGDVLNQGFKTSDNRLGATGGRVWVMLDCTSTKKHLKNTAVISSEHRFQLPLVLLLLMLLLLAVRDLVALPPPETEFEG